MNVLAEWGYTGVVLLMAMESSVFPVPSELVIPPAAYWASQGKMSYLGVIAAGTLGSWLGAACTYWVSRWLGRPLVLRYGKYFLVQPHKVGVAEKWIAHYGTAGIFFARLLPVVRHLISIPAGICRMSFWPFSAMTVIGSAIWCSVLTWFGPRVITPEMFSNAEAMVHAVKSQMHWIVLLVLVVAGLYGLGMWMVRQSHRSATREPA
ncbi:MAG: DedA family protein [Armatimonadetes bacterium]|nr:DedA family protein [Armatimonadota bacterium]